jgi:hypothetical protein
VSFRRPKSTVYFLMHGFVATPGGLANRTRFDVVELTIEQRDALRRLIGSA